MHSNIWEDRQPGVFFFDYLEAQNGYRVIDSEARGEIMQRPLGQVSRREQLPKRAQS